MGGGGGNGNNPTTTPTVDPVQYQTLPAAMPGQIGLLSQQLARGFGGAPADYEGLLNSYYQPMQLPVFQGAATFEALRQAIPEDLRIKPDDGKGGKKSSGGRTFPEGGVGWNSDRRG